MTDLQSQPDRSVQFSGTAGIVLCGGTSSRMGRPKWSLPLGAENCLMRTIGILRPLLSPIIVVAADDQQVIGLPEDVKLVRDQIPGKGPLAGISAGLAHLEQLTGSGSLSAYVTACDVPLLKPEFVASIIGSLGEHEIAAVQEDQFFHPLAAVYRVSLRERIDAMLQADRLRPLFLIEDSDSVTIEAETLRAFDPDLDSLGNMNRPEDYRRILEKLGLPKPAWLT